MSADQWSTCPACEKRRQAAFAKRDEEIAALYGSVPVHEFNRARTELADARSTKVEPTFREDWDIYGASEGTVHVSYSGACGVCGASVSFEVDRPVDMPEPTS